MSKNHEKEKRTLKVAGAVAGMVGSVAMFAGCGNVLAGENHENANGVNVAIADSAHQIQQDILASIMDNPDAYVSVNDGEVVEVRSSEDLCKTAGIWVDGDTLTLSADYSTQSDTASGEISWSSYVSYDLPPDFSISRIDTLGEFNTTFAQFDPGDATGAETYKAVGERGYFVHAKPNGEVVSNGNIVGVDYSVSNSEETARNFASSLSSSL